MYALDYNYKEHVFAGMQVYPPTRFRCIYNDCLASTVGELGCLFCSCSISLTVYKRQANAGYTLRVHVQKQLPAVCMQCKHIHFLASTDPQTQRSCYTGVTANTAACLDYNYM